jgi:ubiquinone/menaquinone biosynthesis C-methylase UbiE
VNALEGEARVNALEEGIENLVEEVSQRSLANAIREATVRRPSQRDQWFDPGYLFRVQAVERLFLNALRKHGFRTLAGCKILDVGCGFGYWLRRYAEWGALPDHLHGVDLLEERIQAARKQSLPGIDLRCCNAVCLDFEDASFDMVSMFLVLSLVPHERTRMKVAAEVARVLRPGGIVLWYDFRYRPPHGGAETIAMTRERIARAFPGFELNLQSASAVPPITRRLARYAWALCSWLDFIVPLNSHYVGVLIKRPR